MKLLRACDCYSTYCEHNPGEQNVKPRDVVKATKDGYPLRCGSGVYDSAIVVSVKPLVMLSEWSDMKWSNFHGPLETVGRVSWFTYYWIIFKRWYNETFDR